MAGLDNRCVAKAKRLVYQKFPEMAGAKPSVAQRRFRSKARAGNQDSVTTRYVVTFQKDVALPGGKKLKRRVRVTMDGAGEVIKLTSSK